MSVSAITLDEARVLLHDPPGVERVAEFKRPSSSRDAALAVFPGVRATSIEIHRAELRRELSSLIVHLAKHGLPTSNGFVKISNETANAALAFFGALGERVAVPRVSPDGEGGLIASWQCGDEQTLAVVDGWRLHVVQHATTPEATYFDDLPFDGETLPHAVTRAILGE